jgi:hypothetical protein
MGFDVSTGAALAVLYAVLLLFTVLAAASGGWFRFLPKSMAGCCSLSSQQGDITLLTTDYFLSARNSASPWALGLSMFASGMGAWVRVDWHGFFVPCTRTCGRYRSLLHIYIYVYTYTTGFVWNDGNGRHAATELVGRVGVQLWVGLSGYFAMLVGSIGARADGSQSRGVQHDGFWPRALRTSHANFDCDAIGILHVYFHRGRIDGD